MRRRPDAILHLNGSNGIYDHLTSRASIVIASPDSPAVQQRFARGRGWRPGISTFRRERDRIVRLSDTGLSLGDDFCAVWHLFDLLPEGRGRWQPKFRYGRS